MKVALPSAFIQPHHPDSLLRGDFLVVKLQNYLQFARRDLHTYTANISCRHSSQTIDQSSSGLSRCVAVYLPTLLPSAVPTSVLLRQCIPPHTRALPSSAWISLTLV